MRIIWKFSHKNLKLWQEISKKSNLEMAKVLANTVYLHYDLCKEDQDEIEFVSALDFAVISSDVKIVRKLFKKEEYEAQINSDLRYSPLHIAAKYGCLEVCRFLIEQGSKKNPEGPSPSITKKDV